MNGTPFDLRNSNGIDDQGERMISVMTSRYFHQLSAVRPIALYDSTSWVPASFSIQEAEPRREKVLEYKLSLYYRTHLDGRCGQRPKK